MKHDWLTVIVAAVALTFAGAAFAQTGGSPSGGAGGTGAESGSSPGGSGGTTGTTGTGGGSGGATTGTLPDNVVGKEIVNAEGDSIGEVESVMGDKLIVSVGGFLGIGDRKVALDKSQVKATGTGEDAKLTTSMTKEQLKALPEHKAGG